MSSIAETIAAISLTQPDTDTAGDLFDLARVCAGHVVPRVNHFRTMHSLLADGNSLPDSLPNGVHRKSFALRAGRELVRRVFDHIDEVEDYASLLRINAMALLAVVESQPLEQIVATLAPSAEGKPIFTEDYAGRHGTKVANMIYLPGMVLTYTPVVGIDPASGICEIPRFETGIWLTGGRHAHHHAASRKEATAVLQRWARDPATAFAEAPVRQEA